MLKYPHQIPMFHHRITYGWWISSPLESPWIAMNLGAGLDRSGERPDPKAHWGEFFHRFFAFFRMCLWWSFLYIYIHIHIHIYTYIYIYTYGFSIRTFFGIRGFYLCDLFLNHLSICQLLKCFPAGFSTHFAFQTNPPHVIRPVLPDGAMGILCMSQIFPMWVWINTYFHTIFRGMNIHFNPAKFWCELLRATIGFWDVLTHRHVAQEHGDMSLNMVFMDQRGTTFHDDAGIFQNLWEVEDPQSPIAIAVEQQEAPLTSRICYQKVCCQWIFGQNF